MTMISQEMQDRIRSVKERIEKLIEQGHLEEAKAAIEKFEKNMPGDQDICSMLAVIHLLEGDADKAEKVLLDGLENDSVHFDLLYNLAYIYEQKGQLQKAMELYCKADTVADAPQKANIGEAVARLKLADSSIEPVEKDRIVFFVRQGMDNFLGDIIRGLSEDYFVRKMIVSDFSQIDKGMEWADICWFEWCDELVIYGSSLPLARVKKIICRLHRYEVFTGYPGKVTWENVDKLVIVTRHLEDIIRTNWPDIPDRVEITVIENGVDIGRYAFKERSKGFNLAMVGYIHSRKNPVLALQVMKKLVDIDKRYKLYVAGTFQEQPVQMYWDYQVRRMGLDGNVIFEGWQKDISSWLEDKNYLISASIHESFGYAIAEAMARGIKPVIHDFLHADEIWPEEYLFNTVDEAVGAILSDDYDSHRYRDFIVKNYPLEKQLDKTRKLIDEMLSFKKIFSRVRNMLDGRERPGELQHEDITVLIPHYNRARTLKEDLDKGLKLGSRPKVIIDNKSVEESDWLDLIEENKEIYNARIIRNEKNEGPGQARRIGLEYVDTGLTAFVDDDDMLLCLEKDKALADIGKLSDNAVLVIPRYVLNYDGNRISVGYDRQCFDGSASSEVLRIISSTGEIMMLLTGGAIGLTNELRKHSDVKNFTVSEDFVLLSRLLSANPVKEVRVTESIAHVRRISGTSLSKSITRQKLALTLIAQAVGCYYCLRDGIAGKDEVLEWMKERAALLQKLYDFGNDFETELIAYLTGEISEEVFVHYIELNGIGIENTLDELAPELKKMRGFFYTEKAKSVLPGKTDRHPLVSVIIPTFNRKDMLKRAVDCALKQDYPNIEVIISDNCSDDGTFEMVRENYGNEKRVIYHRNEKNLGPTMNYNVAFYGLARGEYCMTQSDDDYLIDSGYISKAARMLYENKDLSFVFGGYYYNHEEKNSIYRVKPAYRSYIDGRDFFINFLTQKYPYMPNLCTTLFRRETACAMEILQCDPDCLSADLSILLRLLLGGGAGFIDDIVLVYTLHKRSISRNPGTCVTGGDNDYIGKALTAAKADIGEMKKIRRLAQDVYGFTDEELDTWMIYRVFKYMYWRLNETAGTKREADVLLEYIRQEYPMLMNVLGETVLNRFGE